MWYVWLTWLLKLYFIILKFLFGSTEDWSLDLIYAMKVTALTLKLYFIVNISMSENV